MTPQELKSVLSSGLLSFPLTDFDAQGEFNPEGYVRRLEWLAPYGATALFAAGGTGEFFSLAADEYSSVIKTAVDTCAGSGKGEEFTGTTGGEQRGGAVRGQPLQAADITCRVEFTGSVEVGQRERQEAGGEDGF